MKIVPPAAALLLLAAAAPSQAAVSVFGGSAARDCSAAAEMGATDAKAEATCTDALERELLSVRDRAGTYVNRGIVKLRRADYPAALKDFDGAVRTAPDMSEAYVNRGATLIGLKRYADAVVDLNKALELGAKEPHKAYYDRGLAHEWLDDRVSAQLDFQKALELAPDWGLVKTHMLRYGYVGGP